jgi:hypothetical protein
MNSVACVVTTDFVQRCYARGAPLTEARYLTLGRRAALSMAVLTVLGALGLRRVDKEGAHTQMHATWNADMLGNLDLLP